MGRVARTDGRNPDQLRPLSFERHYVKSAPGAVLVTWGDTRVLVAVTIEERVPRHVQEKNQAQQLTSGWVTAEYAMLPGATVPRNPRERLKLSGRTSEIQRLIGRALRCCVDLNQLGARTFHVDADVIQADGGTRVAAITGGYIALVDAIRSLQYSGQLTCDPVRFGVAAIGLGMVDGVPLLDMCYSEDARAEVDANLVMTDQGDIIELQTTAEQTPLTHDQLMALLELGRQGVAQLVQRQRQALAA
jgi:ribonuclease PH